MGRRWWWIVTAVAASLVAVGCPGPDDADDDEPGDPSDDDDTDDVVYEGCHADPRPADRDRVVVVSLPYDDDAGQAAAWAALTLTAGGEIVDDGERFEMGRATGGAVAFTPDGQVGMVAQGDGSIGVFTVADDGAVAVVHEAFSGAFYASAVVADPTGEIAWIVDGNWAENGGGLYAAPIDCDDGSLGVAELVVAAKLPAALLTLPRSPDRAALVGREADGDAPGADAYLLDWTDGGTTVLGGADAFGDDEAIVSSAAATRDEQFVLIGDNSAFSGIPNRVAVVDIGDTGLEPVQVIDDLEDPMAIVTSPFDDAVLVVSGYEYITGAIGIEP